MVAFSSTLSSLFVLVLVALLASTNNALAFSFQQSSKPFTARTTTARRGGSSCSLVHSPADSSLTRMTAASTTGDNNNNNNESWSAVDDWTNLSSESSHNRVPDSDDIYNQDLTQKAVLAMQQLDKKNSKDCSSCCSDESSQAGAVWLNSAIDTILTQEEQEEVVTTRDDSDSASGLHTQRFVDDMGREIAMLVRCNESPQDMLIEQGRALAPLTVDQLHDVTQLVARRGGQWIMTDFFQEAVGAIFQEHAVFVLDTTAAAAAAAAADDANADVAVAVLDAARVAAWMTKSLGTQEKKGPVGQHDGRVTMTISKYSQLYGSGYLTADDFARLYLEAVVGDTVASIEQDASCWRQLKYQDEEIAAVWRDLGNHGIQSPVESMRAELMEQMQEQKLLAAAANKDSLAGQGDDDAAMMMMDECEIIEESVVNELLGRVRKQKSSHELVELASDKKTPVWIRDGQFVFIDEESCIGCTQCVSAAPSSFKMMEDGRARTFTQRSSPDVNTAVSACPVDCMKHVSFRELKEFEDARDNGDGRDDHRHMGHGNTPLNVAGIDSDANHKSSWYHFLKNKCFMSKSCPQAGCFDCPYSSEPGKNPHFIEKLQVANHVRANHFIETGAADTYRKSADL